MKKKAKENRNGMEDKERVLKERDRREIELRKRMELGSEFGK